MARLVLFTTLVTLVALVTGSELIRLELPKG